MGNLGNKSGKERRGDRKVSSEVAALVHHVELNKAGWWNKGVQRLVKAAIWLCDLRPSRSEIQLFLRDSVGTNMADEILDRALRALETEGTIVKLRDGNFKMSEKATGEYEKQLKETEDLEERVKARFSEAVSKACPELDSNAAWNGFIESFLLPFIKEMGAKTYELISGEGLAIHKHVTFASFVEKFPPEHRRNISETILAFFDPRNTDVKSYILRQLTGYFLLEASALSENTIQALALLANKRPTFTLFVDTNFLFSVLGLHENPSNEAAQLFMDLIQEAGTRVQISLYASPATVDEMRIVLQACSTSFAGGVFTPKLSASALRTNLSGLTRKFLEECSKSKSFIRADDYFKPYITSLVRILKDKGIELYNVKVADYRKDQRVIDDVVSEMETQEISGLHRKKSYEQLEHDVMLWHMANDLRRPCIDTPIDAGVWVVTVDYRFMGFDERKRWKKTSPVALCVHPSTLAQVLQFWVPRSERFESAVMGNMRTPLLLQDFDPSAEQTTIRILQALARYENIDDLSEDTIVGTLVSDALRSRFETEHTPEEERRFIEEGIVEETRKARRERDAAIAESKRSRDKSRKTENELRRERALRKKETRERQDKDRRLKTAEGELVNLREYVRSHVEPERVRRERNGFLTVWVLALGIALLAVFGAGAYYLLGTWNTPLVPTYGAALFLFLAVWFPIVLKRASATPSVASIRWVAAILRVWGSIAAVIGVGLLYTICTALGNLISDAIRGR